MDGRPIGFLQKLFTPGELLQKVGTPVTWTHEH